MNWKFFIFGTIFSIICESVEFKSNKGVLIEIYTLIFNDKNKVESLRIDNTDLWSWTKDNQTLGIISFVLSILTFFMGGIVGVIFASISIICGSGSYKNTFGVIGIVISSIYCLYQLIQLNVLTSKLLFLATTIFILIDLIFVFSFCEWILVCNIFYNGLLYRYFLTL